MLEEYVPRIEGCVRRLSQAEVWQRPNAHCNSVGNLLLHLEGNVRQWILAGLDGRPNGRRRNAEFAATGDDAAPAPDDMLAALRATVTDAVGVVERLVASDLLRVRTYQGQFEETGVGAVLHVMEHFAGHAGQIYDRTKQLRAVDLRHYDL